MKAAQLPRGTSGEYFPRPVLASRRFCATAISTSRSPHLQNNLTSIVSRPVKHKLRYCHFLRAGRAEFWPFVCLQKESRLDTVSFQTSLTSIQSRDFSSPYTSPTSSGRAAAAAMAAAALPRRALLPTGGGGRGPLLLLRAGGAPRLPGERRRPRPCFPVSLVSSCPVIRGIYVKAAKSAALFQKPSTPTNRGTPRLQSAELAGFDWFYVSSITPKAEPQ